MVKDTLRECLARSLLAESSHETKRFCHWQVCLHLEERSTLTRVFFENLTTTRLHAIVHATHGILRASDLNQKHRLLESGLGSHFSCEAATTSRRHDLSCTSVNGIS